MDLSFDQLSVGRSRLPAAVLADGARLPLWSGRVSRVLGCFTHTDMDDFAAVVAEAARVLRIGGRFAYIGLHPCFVGTFADRDREVEDQQLCLVRGYGDDQVRIDRTGRFSLRSRVGGSNLSLAGFLNAFLGQPALRLRSFVELDTGARPWGSQGDARTVPWNIAVQAVKVAV